jgi:hypothetical protein
MDSDGQATATETAVVAAVAPAAPGPDTPATQAKEGEAAEPRSSSVASPARPQPPGEPAAVPNGSSPSAPEATERPPARASARIGSGLRAGWRATIARLATTAVTVVVLLLGVAIAFKALGANPHNAIVSVALDTGKAVAGPFNGMFTPDDHKVQAAVNWGIALVVYLLTGRLVVKSLARE